VAETYSQLLPADQGIAGTAISGLFAPTPTPAELTLDLDAGTYLVTWYSEVMRTTNGGAANFFARCRNVTSGETVSLMRRGPNVQNGPAGAMPDDSDYFQFGDVFPFSGSTILEAPGGLQSYQLEYALSISGTAAEVLRARRQRITITRLE
jgi:hypothetical protein